MIFSCILCFSISSALCALPSDLRMVAIPAGTFQMGIDTAFGNNIADRGTSEAATPKHTVRLSSFQMSQNEITNAQYHAFLQEAFAAGKINVTETSNVVTAFGGPYDGMPYIRMNCKPDKGQHSINRCYLKYTAVHGFEVVDAKKTDWPVVCVTWYGAWGFANWYGLSLPTEAQWEYVAKSTSNFEYATPTAGSITTSLVNYNPSGTACTTANCSPDPVGTYRANSYNLHDIGGNVKEWLLDWYSVVFYKTSDVQDPQNTATSGNFWEPVDCTSSGKQTGSRQEAYSHPTRVMRGGAYSSDTAELITSYRDLEYPFYVSTTIGFRVATGGNMKAAIPTCFQADCDVTSLSQCRQLNGTVNCLFEEDCSDTDVCTQDVCKARTVCEHKRIGSCVPPPSTPPTPMAPVAPTGQPQAAAPNNFPTPTQPTTTPLGVVAPTASNAPPTSTASGTGTIGITPVPSVDMRPEGDKSSAVIVYIVATLLTVAVVIALGVALVFCLAHRKKRLSAKHREWISQNSQLYPAGPNRYYTSSGNHQQSTTPPPAGAMGMTNITQAQSGLPPQPPMPQTHNTDGTPIPLNSSHMPRMPPPLPLRTATSMMPQNSTAANAAVYGSNHDQNSSQLMASQMNHYANSNTMYGGQHQQVAQPQSTTMMGNSGNPSVNLALQQYQQQLQAATGTGAAGRYGPGSSMLQQLAQPQGSHNPYQHQQPYSSGTPARM